jgi:tRNA (cytosine49-C5)-methyltransferase
MLSKKDVKPKFREHYQELLGKEYEKFEDICFVYLRRSIRVNTLKITVPELLKRMEADWDFEPVPWCKEGFFIKYKHEGRKGVGNTIEHQLGYFYVQEAASMIPVEILDPKPGEVILDMCAAPGSKTTQIASKMENKGILVANDYKGKRLASLGMNVQRCGLLNSVITLKHGAAINGMEFDRILVDAPCSATGAIRKSGKTLLMWNLASIRRLAGEQRKLLEHAFKILKKGGVIVYSTCSVEPMEDEGVVNYLINKYENAKLEQVDIKLKPGKTILESDGEKYSPEIKKTLRLWPQDNDTEGFFVARIRKL